MQPDKYKVESLIYYSSPIKGKYHIVEQSTEDIQRILNDYSQRGYRLVSTDAANFGMAMYFYLYFEKIE